MEGEGAEYGGLDLLLVRNEDHKRWYQEVTRIQRRPHGRTFRFPDACLVALNVDNGFLSLEVMSLIEIWPDLDSPEHSNNTWVSMHNVPVVVPIMYSPLDEGMYDDPEIFNGGTAWDRWPFL